MVMAARKTSEVAAHMGIAFAVAYFTSGSLAFGGLAAILEPIANVLLLPSHVRLWSAMRIRARADRTRASLFLAEKTSQTALHLLLGFAFMYWATGSFTSGGLAVMLEAMCNVLFMPWLERAWEAIEARIEANRHALAADWRVLQASAS